MKKYLYKELSYVLLILLPMVCVPLYANASVSITEIMYDAEGTDSDHEWIEVYNGSGVSIDLADWKFYESDTNHTLAEYNGGTTLPAGAHAVIADDPITFESDFPSYSGILIDSAFSLKNDGETLTLRDAEGVDQYSVTYSSSWGAAGDGNSLQYISGSWQASSPTPGAGNSVSQSTDNDDEDDSSSTTSSGSSSGSLLIATPRSSSEDTEKHDEVSVEADIPTRVVAEIPTAFQARVVGEKRRNISVVWNFGDGTGGDGEEVVHQYARPGTYTLYAEVRVGDNVTYIKEYVEVVSREIGIASFITEGREPLMEVYNDTPVEVNLSGWKITTGTENAVLPNHTYLSPDTTITIVLPASFQDVSDSMMLLTKDGRISDIYAEEQPVEAQTVTYAAHTPAASIPTEAVRAHEAEDINEASDGVSVTSFEDKEGEVIQLASVGASDRPGDVYLWWLAALLGVAILAVMGRSYVKEQHKESALVQEALEYEIIEEED